MFTKSPAQRASANRWKKKNPTDYTTEAQREYFREYARKNKQRRNEQRRERRHRHGTRERIDASERIERFGGLSIVSQASLAGDRTRWRGPGWQREENLAREADIWIEEHASMNPAQLEKAREQRVHRKETPLCPPDKCWCGLCHCTRCFAAREKAATERK